uniref:F-box protein SKIP23-like n=1 Tax=Rhizophora mucronata TaxID=61149 RepID=A0A2P2QLI9_RHIMU
MAEWAHLPKDLLEQISTCLGTSVDLLRFRSVCTSWRSSFSPKPPRPSGFFRVLRNDGISHTSFGFCLSKRTIYRLELPDSHDQADPLCWIVKVEEDVPTKQLLNPLSRYKLNPLPTCFPRVLDLLNFRVRELGQEHVLHLLSYNSDLSPLDDASNLYMEKVVMIQLNGERGFILLTIHVSGKLAMFRSGDKKWHIIQDMPSPYDDVIVYGGKFYAVDITGRTVVVGFDAVLDFAANPIFGGDKKYLVKSEGELLLVDMYLSIDTSEGSLDVEVEFLEHFAQYMSERTVRFKVFKLVEESQSWIEVKNLGDRVLFLGDDSTFSASASDFPGCNGNCIFFVDNFFYSIEEYPSGGDDAVFRGRDIGLFQLESGCIGPIKNYAEYSKLFWPPPDWVSSTSSEVQNQN